MFMAAAVSSVRVVISDFDGTLCPFGHSKPISAANVAALTAAHARNIHVSLATGRIPGLWLDRVREQLPFVGPSVFANGALLVAPDGGVLASSTLPPSAVDAVREYTAGGAIGGRRVAVLAATRWPEAGPEYGSVRYVELAPDGPSWVTALIKSAGEPDVVRVADLAGLDGGGIFKFVLFTRAEDADWAPMADAVGHLREALGESATVVDCGPGQCEVLPAGVQKGAGVARLLAGGYLGGDVVPAAAALAIGDAENDVEMLRLAGVGAAVAGAKPAALAAADVVVASCAEDGVAEAVRKYVLEA